MNANLKSCPKCGHSANDTAATCAYCGAVVSAEDPSLQTGKKTLVEATPYSEQMPLMQPDEPLPDITRTEEPVNTVTAVVEWLEPDDSDSPPAADSAEHASEPIDEPAPTKTEHESAGELLDPSQVIESNQEVSPTTSENRVDNHQVAAEANEQEPIPLQVPESEAKTADLSDNAQQDAEEKMKTDMAAEQSRLSPEPDVNAQQDTEEQMKTDAAAEQSLFFTEFDLLKSDDNEPPESAAPELKRSDRDKFEAPAGSDTVLPFDEVVTETQTDKVQDAPPTEADEPAAEPPTVADESVAEPPAVIEHGAPKEDILLTLDEIVQPPAKNTPDSVGELAGEDAESTTGTSTTKGMPDILPSQDKFQTEPEPILKKSKVQSVPTVLKIEKAAQELAEAVKKQKVALAEARALKKQKLMRAKAQALKRKEETLPGTPALKKQKEAPVGSEIKKKEIAKQSISKTKSPPRMTTQGLKAHTKMQALLKKYANQAIGINYDNSADIKEAKLVEVNDEFFIVFVKHNALHYSYPLNTILTVIEGKAGVGSADPEKKENFNVVIKVCPLTLS